MTDEQEIGALYFCPSLGYHPRQQLIKLSNNKGGFQSWCPHELIPVTFDIDTTFFIILFFDH